MIGDLLAGAGLLAATFAAAATLLLPPSPRRSAAMLVALALVPVLILGDQWNSAQIADLRDSPLRFAALGALGVGIVATLAVLMRRHPLLIPLGIIATIPFRIPLHAGGDQANLLIPLYLVIAGGVAATVLRDRSEDPDADAAGLLRVVLAAVIALYALQALYSEDFSKALQNSAFFHVPFALAFALLADWRWDRRLLTGAALVIGAEALVFALVGFWEYGARELLWNDEVIRSNDFHTYFRVNSLFWDPNVLGRYMAIVITALMAVLLWSRSSHFALWLGALCGVLWLGMVITFSQSSFAALLAGLAVLAALRWSLRWTVVVCVAGLIAAAGFVLAAGGSLKIDLSTGHKLNEDVSGRGNLISGGLDLFGDRPLWGYGAGSFSQAFQEHQTDGKAHVNESHTEPITIAAEQGLIGILAYLALLAASFATLLRGMRSAMPGLRGPPAAGPVPGGLSADLPGGSSAGGAARPIPLRAQALSTGGSGPAVTGPAAKSSVTGPAAERSGNAIPTARAAVLACFVALLIHTMAYAGFLEDPLTWALLSIGACLAVAAAPQKGSRPHRQGEEATPTPSARASA